MPADRVYAAVFAVGVALTLLSFGVGIYESLTVDRRLPPVVLDLVIDNQLVEIEELMEAKRYDRAIEQLELTLKLLPTNQQYPHNMLGNALEAQGRLDEAIEHYRRALELDPAFAEAHNNLAVAYAKRGDLDRALAAMREALRLKPEFPEAQQNLARLRDQLARRAGDEAASTTEDSPELSSGRAYARQFYRGELPELHARFAESLKSRMDLAALSAMHRQLNQQLGLETRLLDERVVAIAGSPVYVRRARFERFDGEVEVLIQLDPDRSVAGLMFRPAETPPAP